MGPRGQQWAQGASHGPLQPRPHLLPRGTRWGNAPQSFPKPPSPTRENQEHFQAPSLQSRTAWENNHGHTFRPFGLYDTGRRRTGTPRPPQSSQLKLPGVTRGRPGHGCRCAWNAAVCQGRVTHPHTAQNTTGAAEPAPPARPLGGLPLRHGTDGTRMILPHLGSPSKIQLRARGSRSGCCPLHKLPFPDFPTSPRIIRSRCRGASPGVPTPTSAGHQFAPERRGRGGRHPDFLIEKPRECAIPSQQEGEKII